MPAPYKKKLTYPTKVQSILGIPMGYGDRSAAPRPAQKQHKKNVRMAWRKYLMLE